MTRLYRTAHASHGNTGPHRSKRRSNDDLWQTWIRIINYGYHVEDRGLC